VRRPWISSTAASELKLKWLGWILTMSPEMRCNCVGWNTVFFVQLFDAQMSVSCLIGAPKSPIGCSVLPVTGDSPVTQKVVKYLDYEDSTDLALEKPGKEIRGE